MNHHHSGLFTDWKCSGRLNWTDHLSSPHRQYFSLDTPHHLCLHCKQLVCSLTSPWQHCFMCHWCSPETEKETCITVTQTFLLWHSPTSTQHLHIQFKLFFFLFKHLSFFFLFTFQSRFTRAGLLFRKWWWWSHVPVHQSECSKIWIKMCWCAFAWSSVIKPHPHKQMNWSLTF